MLFVIHKEAEQAMKLSWKTEKTSDQPTGSTSISEKEVAKKCALKSCEEILANARLALSIKMVGLFIFV